MEYFEEIQDRVILIGVQADRGDDMEESLDELGELAATAGVRRLQAGSFRIVRPYIRAPISEKARSKR
mgnify:CR=1 FL=1